MGILAGGVRLILGIAIVACGIFFMIVKIGGVGGGICGIGLIVAFNVMGIDRLVDFLRVDQSTSDYRPGSR